jgi:hypothetical protein
MEPSDILRRIEAQTQFNYKLAELTRYQPGANISTLTSQGTAILQYKSFAERQALALGKFYAEGGSTIGFGFIPNSFAPRPPQIVSFRNTYTYTGSLQQYILPNGTVSIDVWMWGAGGGGDFSFRGGSGAFVSGRITTIDFTTLYIVVGTTGGGTIARGGGGTGAGGGYGNGDGGGGGGFSGVFKSDTLTQGNLIACAAGGGGAGMFGRVGGGGGVTNGQQGTNGCGNGATQSAGGTTGGAALLGATGGAGYGAGGGGYFGGGRNTGAYCGGGGGSSYISLLTTPVTADGATLPDNGLGPATPGGSTNSNYVSPLGQSGQNGYVVISVLAYQ